MKIRVTFEFDDDFRRALAAHFGKPGKADRATLATWINGIVGSTADDITHDYAAGGKGE